MKFYCLPFTYVLFVIISFYHLKKKLLVLELLFHYLGGEILNQIKKYIVSTQVLYFFNMMFSFIQASFVQSNSTMTHLPPFYQILPPFTYCMTTPFIIKP